MKLVDVLACGVRGAESGTAEIRRRGTSTFATIYANYDATGAVTPTTGVALDSNGAAVWYVDEVVDVVVKNSSGSTVRTFTVMGQASAIEVTSQSFTGTDYSTALSAASYPAILEAILDLWKTNSGGAIDWKVVAGGSSKTLATAFSEVSGLFYNVKATTYGAVGDASANDTSAIQAAIDAANTAGGGVVFFPAGNYRITSALNMKANVSLLGAGARASTILIDHASNDAISVAASGGNEPQFIRGLEIMPFQSNSGKMIVVESGSIVNIDDCTVGQSLLTGKCVSYANAATVVTITNSILICNGATAYHVYGPTAGTLNLIGCKLLWSATNLTTYSVYARGSGCFITGCTFDLSAITNAAANGYVISTGDTTYVSITSSRIMSPAVGTSITTIDQTVTNFFEQGLSIGGGMLHAVPTVFLLTPANHEGTFHAARETRRGFVTDDSAAIAIPSNTVGMYEVRRTTTGNQTITFSGPSAAGHYFTLTWNNDHAGAGGTITLAGNVKGLTSFSVNANRVSHYHFRAVENSAAGAGSCNLYWVNIGAPTVNVTP